MTPMEITLVLVLKNLIFNTSYFYCGIEPVVVFWRWLIELWERVVLQKQKYFVNKFTPVILVGTNILDGTNRMLRGARCKTIDGHKLTVIIIRCEQMLFRESSER